MEQCDRLPDALVVERLLVGAHVELAVHRGAQLDDLDVRIGEQGLAGDRRELREDVHLAALDGQDRAGSWS